MKKVYFLLLTTLILCSQAFSQKHPRDYNLDFSKVKNGLPIGWKIIGNEDYTIAIDSTEKLDGKPTLKISSDTDTSKYWAGLSFHIPDNFRGKSLQLVTSIKTKGVNTGGHAGILVNVKPDGDFQNLEHENINGDRDWREEYIQVNLQPKNTDSIAIAIYLQGTGTAWFGNLRLFVDWKEYKNVSIYEVGADSIYRSNSHVPQFELTSNNQQILKDVAQIWGLVKYFHPAVAEGKWDMDTELFKFIPKILVLKTNQDVEQELKNWIKQFGVFSAGSDSNRIDYKSSHLKQEADFRWIDQLSYSSDLKAYLHALTQVNPVSSHYYITYLDGPNHPSFYESSYPNTPIDDIGVRLMGLFRYWNIVNYFFPYRYLTDHSWDDVLEEFIPVFYEANTINAIDSAYLRLIAKSDDSHSFNQLSSSQNAIIFGHKNIGIQTKIINEKAVITAVNTELSQKNLLSVGDVISEIDGITIKEIIQNKRPFVASSNEGTALRDIAKLLFRTNKEELSLKIIRDGEPYIVKINTFDIESLPAIASKDTLPFRILENRIGYISSGKFRETHFSAFQEHLKDLSAIILDYRHYPVSEMHRLFSDHLFPEESIFARFSHNRNLKPGTMIVQDSSNIGKYNPNYFKGKVVILIDSEGQSASEFQTMAFQTIPGAIVIGSNSAGADGNISSVTLPYGYRTWFSGIGVYYPNLSETQRIGITPDIFVEQTAEGIRDGRDEVLEAAIKYIDENKKTF